MNSVTISLENEIASVTLNRPEKRNALDENCIHSLLQTLQDLDERKDIRVLILKGEGAHFCAGADINWMQSIQTKTFSENEADALKLAQLLYALYTFSKPTIALAQGKTLGGGLGLLAASDIVIANRDAEFGFSEVKIGLTPSTISPYVINAIGERMARFYFLTGKSFNAETALNMNLIHLISETNSLHTDGYELARTLIENAPNALCEVKKLMQMVAGKPIIPNLIEETAKHLATIRVTDEAQEGLSAFLQKRKPVWS